MCTLQRLVAASVLTSLVAAGQHEGHQHGAQQKEPSTNHHSSPNMSGMNHGAMDHSAISPPSMFLLGQSSGTAFQPASWPMPMLMSEAGEWRLMWMGQAYIAGIQQSGPRGGSKVYSPNWGMLAAVHGLGRGSLMLRSMVSLEPLTVTHRRYPLLFQTGESAFGTPLVDAQHPHDLVMELSVQYAHPAGRSGMLNVYYAPVGDPALGPVAFPHRASALELPQATLAHHWQDSTHIASNVVTAGFSWSKIRIEASGFRGREPDENRWNIDIGPIDSWSSRLSVFPARNWMAQVSGGRLVQPEPFHPDNVDRITASVHHVVPRGANYWATSFIWGQNYKTIAQRRTNTVVAETVVPLARRNFVSGRFEWSQRDELFDYDHDLAHEMEERTGKAAFPVAAFTIGYTRDVELVRNVQTGIGVNVTSYAIDRDLRPFYGNRPWGVQFFVRVRVRGDER